MRIFGTVAALLALCLSLYNGMQLRRLRAEVDAVKRSVATREEKAAREARSRELLRQAEEHSKRAQELMRKGDLAGARQEMRRSMELVSESAQSAGGGDIVAQIREGAEGTIRRLEEILARAKKQLPEKQPPPGKK